MYPLCNTYQYFLHDTYYGTKVKNCEHSSQLAIPYDDRYNGKDIYEIIPILMIVDKKKAGTGTASAAIPSSWCYQVPLPAGTIIP